MAQNEPANNGAKQLIWAVFAVLVALLLLGAFNLYGGYDVAADQPHSAPALWLANTARTNSVSARAKDIALPAGFGSDAQVKAGASEYAEMCSQCHLAPGAERSEISQGLYPRAPELAKGNALTPEEQFWVVKHGIKMTGMPAWGVTHDDKLIWSIVAFIQKLPTLSTDEYKMMTKDAAEEHEEMKDMPGMNK